MSFSYPNYTIFGDSYNTNAELSGATKTAKEKFNNNKILRYVRTRIVIHNPDNFTDLKMQIYSDDGGSKGYLIAESLNTWQKSDLTTLAYAAKEIWFKFDYVPLHSDLFYHFALVGNGTSFDADKHIQWQHSWPDYIYKLGRTNTFEELSTSSYYLYYIGSAF